MRINKVNFIYETDGYIFLNADAHQLHKCINTIIFISESMKNMKNIVKTLLNIDESMNPSKTSLKCC